MRIGLFRHFPVSEGFPSGWITAAELQAWRTRYDTADAQIGKFDLGGITWAACLSSDLARARTTASTVFRDAVQYTPQLREPHVAPFNTGGLRLPVPMWRGLLTLAWMTGRASQRRHRDDFLQCVREVADQLCGREQDTLVVSHAGTMMYLSRELRRRGFSGPKLRSPDYAIAYIYERVR